MHLKPQRTLRINITKRKTYLNSLSFLYVFKFGRESLAKSYSLKCAQRILLAQNHVGLQLKEIIFKHFRIVRFIG